MFAVRRTLGVVWVYSRRHVVGLVARRGVVDARPPVPVLVLPRGGRAGPAVPGRGVGDRPDRRPRVGVLRAGQAPGTADRRRGGRGRPGRGGPGGRAGGRRG